MKFLLTAQLTTRVRAAESLIHNAIATAPNHEALVGTGIENDRFDAPLLYSTAANRVCPQPTKWDAFWRLLGSPRDRPGPPGSQRLGVLN
jgi:hypothetical protein